MHGRCGFERCARLPPRWERPQLQLERDAVLGAAPLCHAGTAQLQELGPRRQRMDGRHVTYIITHYYKTEWRPGVRHEVPSVGNVLDIKLKS
jgi:hypothetical protein